MTERAQVLTVTETPYGFPGKTQIRLVVAAENPGAATVYLKFYDQDATPTGASVPVLSLPVAATSTDKFAVFHTFRLRCWVAAAEESGAGLTAPAGDLLVSLTYQ